MNTAERIRNIIIDNNIKNICIPHIRMYARDLDDDTIEATLSTLCTLGFIQVYYLGFVVEYRRTE